MNRTCIAAAFLIPLLLAAAIHAEPSRWEQAIQRFEAQDAENPPPKNAILFYGSSSIRMWKTDKDFSDLDTINRGFGGSQTADALEFVDRVVIPYEPRTIVFYEGDNDIAAGKTPEQVFADAKQFFETVHEALPETRILFIAIKPSLARWELVDDMRRANDLIRAYTEIHENFQFVDIDTPMLGEDGMPRKELFIQDGLHLSREGYDLWNSILRPYLDGHADSD